jgi:hypothetical protein
MKNNTFSIERNNIFSVWQYISRIILVVLLSLICFQILGNDDDALYSFLGSSAVFLLITIFSVLLILRKPKKIMFFILAYLIKLFIGLFHYLFFIDPEYFEGSGKYKALTFEFESVFFQILSIKNDKISNGLLYFNYDITGASHQELLSIISVPFIYFGDYVLTITPVNTFFSLFTAMNMYIISKYCLKLSEEKSNLICLIIAFFPFTLISSLLWRDVVGIALMSSGLTAFYLSKLSVSKILTLFLTCYLFYLHRTIYPFLLIVAYIISQVFSLNSKGQNAPTILKVATLALSLSALPLIFKFADTEQNFIMLTSNFKFSILLFPFKILIGLIGPFPWINFMLYDSIPAYAYQLQDYLQGAFNVAFVFMVFRYRSRFFKKNQLTLLNILGILLIFSGLFNQFMHVPYIAIGFMFLTPAFFTIIKGRVFGRTYLITFLGLIGLNILVLAVVNNLGISALWK